MDLGEAFSVFIEVIPLTRINRYKDGVVLNPEQGEQLECIAEAMYQAV